MLDMIEIERRLMFHEGLKLSPYTCPAGYKTIGVGRNLDLNPLTPEEKKVCPDAEHGITKNGAIFLLRNDIARCKADLERNFEWFHKLDNERQYALIDMCFNMGITKLCKFRKMLAAMEVKNWSEASAQCLDSSYAVQVPKRAKRIAKLIKTGYWEY
jgi:lysozyme